MFLNQIFQRIGLDDIQDGITRAFFIIGVVYCLIDVRNNLLHSFFNLFRGIATMNHTISSNSHSSGTGLHNSPPKALNDNYSTAPTISTTSARPPRR